MVGDDDAALVTPKQRRRRKPSLVTVAKQAAREGLEVARYAVDPDGKITVFTRAPMATANPDGNEWDTVQ